MTREQALEEMEHDPYPSEELMREDKGYVARKLGLTEQEFEEMMSLPVKSFRDYPTNYWLLPLRRKVGSMLRKLGIA